MVIGALVIIVNVIFWVLWLTHSKHKEWLPYDSVYLEKRPPVRCTVWRNSTAIRPP